MVRMVAAVVWRGRVREDFVIANVVGDYVIARRWIDQRWKAAQVADD